MKKIAGICLVLVIFVISTLPAAAQQDDIARGFSAGATDYLTKPFSPVRLLSLVERLAPRLAWPPA